MVHRRGFEQNIYCMRQTASAKVFITGITGYSRSLTGQPVSLRLHPVIPAITWGYPACSPAYSLLHPATTGYQLDGRRLGGHFLGTRRAPRVVPHPVSSKINVAGRPGGPRRPREAELGPPV